MNLYSDSNLAILTDLYELTMMQGYYFHRRNVKAVFDMFFRRAPFGSGYTVFAGLEPLVEAILNFRFSREDIKYLDNLKLFKPEFMEYLSQFKFNGDIYSVEEGEIVFPHEPLIRIHANIIEAQLLESLVLNITNFQTLIATKTARIKESAGNREVTEFGLRRAHGIDGALSASRAAFIGGASSTSNLLAGKIFNIPVKGTMAHSWVMAFGTELESFEKYARLYPNATILLVDTYDTLGKGIPAAIKVFKKLKKMGVKKYGIRLDSGDLEYLSKRARLMMDREGFKEAMIIASNELDEHIIEQLIQKKSPIDIFGVGTNLVTAKGDSALTGVYKLVAIKEKNEYIPKIKVSDNPEKITSPHVKNILRVYNNEDFMAGDMVLLESEKNTIKNNFESGSPITFYHPDYDYKSLKINNCKKSKIMLNNIVRDGKLNYEFPGIEEIHNRVKNNLACLHPTFKRLLNPHKYKVSISENLKELKLKMINKYK